MTKGLLKGKVAQAYDARVKGTQRTQIYNNFILNNIKSNSTICDLCCGTGNSIEILKDQAKEIIGIDGSQDMLNIAKNKFKDNSKVKLKVALVNQTGLETNYFDYVVFRMSLHHLKDKEVVLNEIYRILKQNGKMILIDRFVLSKFKHKLREIYRLIFKFDKAIFGHFEYSKDEMIHLLSQKFKIIKKEFCPPYSGLTGQAYMFVLGKKSQ